MFLVNAICTSSKFHRYSRGLRYDLLKVSENKLLGNFTDHVRIVNRPAHISGAFRSCLYQENLDGNIFY